ncbi:Gfo/Idh/MocA family protein [Tengunoibacter tsumagoiensis]|uniref:Oxidoreductase n=1 Tax=Tengunoibacter tsumagoiensis TaxID=2014871 RepID=A0A402AAZ4_9CHLR|nr:Gfo/Idh/MocA family oxidoreductase [Tengunoibacter tsumagoiensis]GCE16111.1 oxidoreductase [Tengunoibacter tsumagoiensis]
MALRLVQVGLGGIGGHWFRTVLTNNPAVELVGWVEIIEEVLANAIEQWGLPAEKCFTSLDEALKQCEPDAVLITASLAGHVSSARTALLAGKHVLMEKPFAPSIAEAKELVELAERQQRILMISQNYRFSPRVQVAKHLLEQKIVGEVGTVYIDFRFYANAINDPNHRHYQIWQPLLADMAIHHFDLMRYVLGQEPQTISCVTWNPIGSHFKDAPSASATITFERGTVVSYRGSWVSQARTTAWTGEWQMDCDQGEIFWSDRSESPSQDVYLQVQPIWQPRTDVEIPEFDLPKDFHGSLSAFIQAIQSGKQPSSAGSDNIKSLALTFAAIASASAHGAPITISSLL